MSGGVWRELESEPRLLGPEQATRRFQMCPREAWREIARKGNPGPAAALRLRVNGEPTVTALEVRKREVNVASIVGFIRHLTLSHQLFLQVKGGVNRLLMSVLSGSRYRRELSLPPGL